METTRDEILDMLAEDYCGEPIQPDEFTARMFAERAGITIRAATNRMKTECDIGKFEKRRILIDRHWTNVYKKKEQ